MSEENKKRLAVIRIRGQTGIKKDIKDTLKMLCLYRSNYCVVVDDSLFGMIRKAKDYVTWGEIDDETYNLLVEKRGKEYKGRLTDSKKKINYKKFIIINNKKYKKYFRLSPPRGGFERKGIKTPFTKSGALGYRKEKINPASSCLPLLIQLPFFIAVYRVFRTGLTSDLTGLYSFIHNPGTLNPIAFGFLDLSKPNFILALLAGAAQFWQARMMTTQKPPKQVEGKPAAKDEGMAAAMNKQMLYVMPIITVVIAMSLPSGLALYWFITTLLMALQQLYFFRKDNKKGDNIPPTKTLDVESSEKPA